MRQYTKPIVKSKNNVKYYSEKNNQQKRNDEQKKIFKEAKIKFRNALFARHKVLYLRDNQNSIHNNINNNNNIPMKIKRSYLEKFSKIEAVQLKQQEINQSKFDYEMANCEKKLVPGAGDCFLFFANGLNKSESLTHLNLSGCKLHPFLAMEIFQAIALNQKITHLDLSNNNLSSFLLSYLFLQLQANKTLISLNLFNNQHFDSRVIRDMLNNLFNKPDSSLQELNIGFCNFSEEALVKLFFGLKKSDSLTKLKITYQQFGEKSLTALGNYLRKFIPLYHQTNNKFELDISNNMISKEGIQLLLKSQAWYQVHLRSLNLSFNGLTQDSIGTIKQFLDKLYKSKCLNLSHNGLYDVSELCEKCQQFQNLRELDLSNNQLSEFDPQLLPHLLKLNLSNNNIKFNGALILQEYIKYNPVLKELNLNNNSIKSEGFNLIIFGLRQNTNLKYLYVRRNKIQSESLLCMQVNQDGLPLTVLDLSENSLETDQVLMYLSSLKNCELESIKISETEENTKPNSDPLQFLLNAQKLKKLDFSFTKYLGIHMIINLGHHLFHSLQDLDFSYCIPFTIQGVKGLTKMLTNNDNLKSLNIAGLQLGLLEYHEKESKEIKRIEVSTELRKLAESIKSCSLKTLNLSENYLGRHDNYFLEYLALNLTIQNLNLSYNDLSIYHKEQLQYLLEKNRTLQKLSLEGNKIQFNQLYYQLKKQETRRPFIKQKFPHF
ncbi:hypothetical protein PPERSA_02504 [Pseudocohnilembus persalinus]|uniref:Uncharacterized protein n=1 Tax=Pseudocohnilembus persalinus TaxID=266149 RepID=A0A0V0QB22_PSEPJ|nr:hypothetical protein PPERSA_02504 [Pseudocohnilembus persalinus]|eukprot:KRW99392.1 hypothetical protein PPERSA_02504 [Pseudocohnilembus persalinus]